MKAAILTLFFFAISSKCYGQAIAGQDSTAIAMLKKYMATHVKYPVIAKENKYYAQVFVYFKVNADRTLSDFEIIQGLQYNLGDEVIRVLKNAPFKGLNIKPDVYTCSVMFILKGEKDDVKPVTERIANPEKFYKNLLFDIDVVGYIPIVRRVVMVERTSYTVPDFDNHKGSIKTLTINKFETNADGKKYKDSLAGKTVERFNNSGKLTVKDWYYKGFSDEQKFVYDAAGNKTAQFNYHVNNIPYMRQYFEYDNKNRLVHQIYYHVNNGSIYNETLYQYSGTGLLLSELTVGAKQGIEFFTIYKYDLKGKRIAETRYEADQHQQSRTTFAYDTAGNKIAVNHYNGVDSLDYRDVYKYDGHHHVTEGSLYSNEGKLSWTDTFKYDNKGIKIEEAVDIMGSFPNGTKSTFAYSDYDKHGNWRKATWFNGHESKWYVIEREIKYYP